MIRAWHFVGDTLRDGRPVPPDGEWLTHDGPVAICETGLHASKHPFDALQYAPEPVLCMVECDDVVAEHDDKFVCRRRRIIARHDMAAELRAFARQCALDVIHLCDAPAIVRQYLETGNESLKAAARSAAAAALGSAAWDAASAVSAAVAAAAAVSAASDAVWAAAGAAAGAAARDAQKTKFAALVNAKFGVTP